jgi:hypothetical protein
MATETPKQRLASLLLETPVAPWIRKRRRQGKAWRVICAELRDATRGEIDVPIQTLINWAPDPAPTAQPSAEPAEAAS